MTDGPGVAWHQPVMVREVLQYLAPHPPMVIVDGTAGTGGHSLALLPPLLPSGRLIAVDRDPQALRLARQRLAEFEPQAACVPGNYRDLPEILARLSIERIDGLLLDLGMSSLQVDRSDRGFSFSREGPLDMRMDPAQELTAEAIVNAWAADELSAMLETLGEERFARRIAAAIVRERRAHPIRLTTELARVVVGALPASLRHSRLHAATRTFQALRMAVNDELGALEQVLARLPGLLNPGGRAVILTFHSLEDRLVKRAFLQGQRDGAWTVLTKKPLPPSDGEVAGNPRARSVKLRAVERNPS